MREYGILLQGFAIMLVIAVPTMLAAAILPWWLRSKGRSAWAFSGQVELIVWAIPSLIILFLGGLLWMGSHRPRPVVHYSARQQLLAAQLPMDALGNLDPMDGNRVGCADADAYLSALQLDDGDRDVFANDQRLPDTPRENQHPGDLLFVRPGAGSVAPWLWRGSLRLRDGSCTNTG
jgi:hypothetical protein